ncbi:MAG: nitrate reductase molybdenum cofactor assembly chaperone [Pyrinomonadaceae bacterium]
MKNKPVQITRNSTAQIEPFETGETLFLLEKEIKLLNSLAGVLEYPTENWFLRFEKCKSLILLTDRAGCEHFSDFCLDINKLSLTELQEFYTRTFDLSPVCALEVGYHLFGEDYKRGEFLARLRETENPYSLGQEQQLPDYLPVILRLLGQMEDAEERAAMIGYCLIPALKMMSEALGKKKNIYENIIRFLLETLKHIAEKSVGQDEKSLTELRYQYA